MRATAEDPKAKTVGSAIFGDGCAAALLSNDPRADGPIDPRLPGPPDRRTRSTPCASISAPRTATCTSRASCRTSPAPGCRPSSTRFLRRNHARALGHRPLDRAPRRQAHHRERAERARALATRTSPRAGSALAEHGNVGTPSIFYVLKDTIERYAPAAGRARADGDDRPRRDRRADAARLVAAGACAHYRLPADAHRRDPARQALRPGQAAPRRERRRPAATGAGARDGRRRAARARADRARSSARSSSPASTSVAAAARAAGRDRDRRQRRETASAPPSALGVERALAEGIERVLCVPGDCPALDPDELDALLAADAPSGAARAVVIVPDRHGTGTNGLLLAPAGRDLPELRARQLRAPPRARARQRASLPHRAPCRRCCSTSTPARTSPCCARDSRGQRRAGAAHPRGARRRPNAPDLLSIRRSGLSARGVASLSRTQPAPACRRCAPATTSPR